MGVPTSEVGYTIATTRRETTKVHKNMWWHWKEKKHTSTLKTEAVSPSTGRVSTKLHGVASQKAAPLIFAAAVVWNDYETQEWPASVWPAIALYSASPQVPMAAVPYMMYLRAPVVKYLPLWTTIHSLTHPNAHLKTRTSIACSQEPVAGPFWVGWIQSIPSNPI